MTAELWKRDLGNQSITGPDGQPVSVSESPEGERVQVSFDAQLPGVYRVGANTWAEAINLSAIESDMRAIDDEELTDRATGAPAGEGHFVKGAEDYEQPTTGEPIAHWFLIALAAALLIEMLLHRPFNRRPAS